MIYQYYVKLNILVVILPQYLTRIVIFSQFWNFLYFLAYSNETSASYNRISQSEFINLSYSPNFLFFFLLFKNLCGIETFSHLFNLYILYFYYSTIIVLRLNLFSWLLKDVIYKCSPAVGAVVLKVGIPSIHQLYSVQEKSTTDKIFLNMWYS